MHLKPCPCCGGAAIPDAMMGEEAMPGCSVCSLVADTVEDWNTRLISADEMSLRDYFAAHMMVLANSADTASIRDVAEMAYRFADAMLAARDGDAS